MPRPRNWTEWTGGLLGECDICEEPSFLDYVSGGKPTVSGVVDRVAAGLMDDLKRPEFRAGLAAGFAVELMLIKAHAGFLPTVIISSLVALSAAKAYEMVTDIHQVSLMQQEYLRRQFREPSEPSSA